MFLLCCASVPFVWQTQVRHVRLAEDDYAVEFEDTLAKAQRRRIAADLATLAAFARSFERLQDFLPGGSEGVSIVDRNGKKSMRVGKRLSDKYLQAFVLMDTHRDAVKKAYEFVDFLNRTHLPSQPMPVIRSLFHIETMDRHQDPPTDDTFRNVVATLKQYKFSRFSALHFSVRWVPPFGGKDIPVVEQLPMVHESDPAKDTLMPIDFYNGRWGFGRSPL
jgi:hypothetical protein